VGDPTGDESLCHAAESGHAERLKLLLADGADPNEEIAGHPSGELVVVIPGLHRAARRM
jgi:ankyrin repeat protein